MATKLVIVESPAKARTLSKILGHSYHVKASNGHVRDLPKSQLGVDTSNFSPKYSIPQGKRKIVKEIRSLANHASAVYLATDPDREGEAISWHLSQVINQKKDRETPIHRVIFHEITSEAVKQAFQNTRDIDMKLVYAQQARRILDRLVGYKLSPLLWHKVQKGLSAGRVQSVAVKIIVDREQEIQDFLPTEYWVIEVELARPRKRGDSFTAILTGLADGSRIEISSQDKANKIAACLEQAKYTVIAAKTRQTFRQPSPPFITSTLQQEAWRKLHFSARQTMRIAQQLFEGLPVAGEGPTGLITYMRTDSIHVATPAIVETRDYIKERYGGEFLPPKSRSFARKKGKWAQEAHEAIRPTIIHREPSQIRSDLDSNQFKLYELIWKRMVASQMAAASYNTMNIEIKAQTIPDNIVYLLKASSSALKFPGFTSLYSESADIESNKEPTTLPEVEVGQELLQQGISPTQHFTQPPPRYTEATLVKILEKRGIGRPSTYASIISTIQDREYVHKENGKFLPSEMGFITNSIISKNFRKIVDLNFTAHMEEQLDEIAQGKEEWNTILKEFYPVFEELLHQAEASVERIDTSKPSDEVCPKCGRSMVIKTGRFGKFLACSGYPDCKTTLPFIIKTGAHCLLCGGELVQRRNKRKQTFYGCNNYPQCKFTTRYKPLPQPCPKCGKLLVEYRRGHARCLNCDYKTSLSGQEDSKQKGEVTT